MLCRSRGLPMTLKASLARCWQRSCSRQSLFTAFLPEPWSASLPRRRWCSRFSCRARSLPSRAASMSAPPVASASILRTPRLKGLLAINLAVAAAGALVIVNTVVYVQASFGLDQQSTALALAAFGGGSMVAALALPAFSSACRTEPSCSAARRCSLSAPWLPWRCRPTRCCCRSGSSSVWATPPHRPRRAGCSAVRQNRKTDRGSLPPSLRCHMPAGWSPIHLRAGRVWRSGWPAWRLVLAGMAALAVVLGLAVWPADDPDVVEHSHDELPAGHPHLAGQRGHRHAHAFVIDELHGAWPYRQ